MSPASLTIDMHTIGAVVLTTAGLAVARSVRRLPVPGRLPENLRALATFALVFALVRLTRDHLDHAAWLEYVSFGAVSICILALPWTGRGVAHWLRESVEATTRARDEYERALADYRRLVYHRMFNPLTVIHGLADTLRLDATVPEAERQRMYELISEQVRRLEHLTTDPARVEGVEEHALGAVPDPARIADVEHLEARDTIDEERASNAFRRDGMWQRTAPYLVAAAIIVFGALAYSPHLDLYWYLPGVVGTVGLTALMFVIPWDGRLRSVQVALPLSALGVIALLRESDGGAQSAFTPLALLPTLYMAIHGSRAEFRAMLVGIGLMFAVPVIVIGAPAYPPSEWPRGLVWIVLVALVGSSIEVIVHRAQVRERQAVRTTMEALRRSRETQRAIDSLPFCVFALDRDGRIEFVSGIVAELLGYAPDELVGRSMHGALHHAGPGNGSDHDPGCQMHEPAEESRGPAGGVLWARDGVPVDVVYLTSAADQFGWTVSVRARASEDIDLG